MAVSDYVQNESSSSSLPSSNTTLLFQPLCWPFFAVHDWDWQWDVGGSTSYIYAPPCCILTVTYNTALNYALHLLLSLSKWPQLVDINNLKRQHAARYRNEYYCGTPFIVCSFFCRVYMTCPCIDYAWYMVGEEKAEWICFKIRVLHRQSNERSTCWGGPASQILSGLNRFGQTFSMWLPMKSRHRPHKINVISIMISILSLLNFSIDLI